MEGHMSSMKTMLHIPASLSWAMSEPQAHAKVPGTSRNTLIVLILACQAVIICLSQPCRTQIGHALPSYSNYLRANDAYVT